MNVTGFANEIACGDVAKPIPVAIHWAVIAQQVRDSAVDSYDEDHTDKG